MPTRSDDSSGRRTLQTAVDRPKRQGLPPRSQQPARATPTQRTRPLAAVKLALLQVSPENLARALMEEETRQMLKLVTHLRGIRRMVKN
ncbi:hypothetical protein [Deinococcus arenicola]|uniref:MarR family transcriptional regulator n=1 Tax=Deinococcus arenicola TaxID=2994950 RepID=A0ABU4DS61_9DEIO|nr:hypothetical protein [Deinococcus sp. ZS9-10]MDV6375256.1 hypothetical protein [Deinococcus sp. ZS9-10]